MLCDGFILGEHTSEGIVFSLAFALVNLGSEGSLRSILLGHSSLCSISGRETILIFFSEVCSFSLTCIVIKSLSIDCFGGSHFKSCSGACNGNSLSLWRAGVVQWM